MINEVSNSNLEFESSSFFNFTTNQDIIKYESTGRSTLRFDKCCFFNMNTENSIISSKSQCYVTQSSFLNNTAKTLLQCNSYSDQVLWNNISYNKLYDIDHYISIYSTEAGLKAEITQNIFAHNNQGFNMVCFWNYDVQTINGLIFVNNSCSAGIIHIGTSVSQNAKFEIKGCYFFNNLKYQTTEFLPIFTSQISNSKIYVTMCQTDSTFPSNPSYTYLDNKENLIFNNDDIVVWNYKNISIAITPPQSEGFVCQIYPDLPWPTSTPTFSPTFSPSETPNETPVATPTESLTQSPFASPTKSPTESCTESPTQTPSLSPSSSLIFESTLYVEPSATSKNKDNKTGLICGIVIALIALIVIVAIVIFFLKKKHKLCFGSGYNTSALSSIDLLESNSPILDSNNSELMSGSEDVFSKSPRKGVFNYSLIV